MQVESDERCASVLKTHFPGARLHRDVSSLEELPAETEVLAAAVQWPEQDLDERMDKSSREQIWLPASRASVMAEHAHIFASSQPVQSLGCLDIQCASEWTTAAIPGETSR